MKIENDLHLNQVLGKKQSQNGASAQEKAGAKDVETGQTAPSIATTDTVDVKKTEASQPSEISGAEAQALASQIATTIGNQSSQAGSAHNAINGEKVESLIGA